MTLNTLTRKCYYIALATLAPPFMGISPAPAADSERETIQKLVQDSQRAGHLKHDLDKYMSMWTDDAKIIIGRSEKAGPYDLTIPRKKFETTRKLRYRPEPDDKQKLTFEDTQVEIDGDNATLTHRATFLTPDYIEVLQEVYSLRKTPDGWRAFKNRWWPIKIGDPDRPFEYTEDSWMEADQQVKRAQRSGSVEDQYSALMSAWRLQEALSMAKKWTADSPDNPQAWLARGTAAIACSEAEEIEKSFRKALKIDPESQVPEFMRTSDESTKRE